LYQQKIQIKKFEIIYLQKEKLQQQNMAPNTSCSKKQDNLNDNAHQIGLIQTQLNITKSLLVFKENEIQSLKDSHSAEIQSLKDSHSAEIQSIKAENKFYKNLINDYLKL